MKPTPPDQNLAQKLLVLNEKGYTFGHFLKSSAKSYLFLIAYLVFAGTVFTLIGAKDAANYLFFAFIIIILRDLGWVRRIKSTWPFSQKVTDWEKVRRIAEGESTPPALPPAS